VPAEPKEAAAMILRSMVFQHFVVASTLSVVTKESQGSLRVIES
jgi:hypothetical protein